jgi:hypothetical protein
MQLLAAAKRSMPVDVENNLEVETPRISIERDTLVWEVNQISPRKPMRGFMSVDSNTARLAD